MNPHLQSRSGGIVVGELIHNAEVCLLSSEAKSEDGSLGQITACLTGVGGELRPVV